MAEPGSSSNSDDSVEARIPASCPPSIAQVLHLAWQHKLAELKPLLNVPGRASVQEPATGETPLHAAIRACAPANRALLDLGRDPDEEEKEEEKEVVADRARAVVRELFLSGAIWNDVDSNDETPGCVAARLGLGDLYTLCVEAGVRAELLFGLLDGYEELESDDGEEGEDKDGADDEGVEEEVEAGEGADNTVETEGVEDIEVVVNSDRAFVPPKRLNGPDVNSKDYLRSNLTYSEGKLVDSEDNGVMSMCIGHIESNNPLLYLKLSSLTPISAQWPGKLPSCDRPLRVYSLAWPSAAAS